MEMRWAAITNSVSQLASMLAENLRIIIEPQIASRLQYSNFLYSKYIKKISGVIIELGSV